MSKFSSLFDKGTLSQLAELDEQARYQFIHTFWPDASLACNSFDSFSSEAIVTHIGSQLERVRHHGHLFAAKTFDQMREIANILSQQPSIPYEQVLQTLGNKFTDASPAMIRRSVELTVRIWLTFDVHSLDISVGPISAGDTPINWSLGISLEQLLRKTFGIRSSGAGHSAKSKFDPSTTASYLVNTCGLRLRWSDDLASHLNFDVDRLELTLYRHKACLISHIDGPSNCPVPKDILEEVLDTMDLLLPPWDNTTSQLLNKEGQQSLYTLGYRKSIRELDISHYQYFGDRLQYLFDSFDKAPRTWKQLALDRRNKLEWSAFWVTVMVGVLTLVSIPCNIIQATYSVKAYNVALKQGA